jgi:hypothetical protein
MTAVRTLWGPAAIGVANIAGSAVSAQALTDADNAVAWVFNVPKDGTITDVGYLVTAENGTSPAYNCGLVTVDATGNPTTTAYGGSAVTPATWTSTGWKWVTLSTPATGAAGDFAAVHIYPGGTPPDGSNNITVAYGPVADGGYSLNYVVAWTQAALGGPMAIKYNDGSIYGFALTSVTTYVAGITSGTTPDEVGAKFQVPAAMTCTGARLGCNRTGYGSAATMDVVLYSAADGVLASTTVSDKDFLDVQDYVNVHWDAVNLSAATDYRLIIKPTTATNGGVTVTKWSVESTAARNMWPAGDSWHWTERTDAGAWTDTTTAIPYMGLWVSDITFGGAAAYEYGYIG